MTTHMKLLIASCSSICGFLITYFTELTLNNIDHTLGNILSEGLQKHSNVIK